MASIRQRGKRWQVRWYNGGRRTDPECSETFPEYRQATIFKGHVDASGQRYPPGWVPGVGFLSQPESGPTLAEWFERALASNAQASDQTKADYQNLFAKHVPGWLASKPVEQITREDAGLWLADLRATRLKRRGEYRPIAEKSVQNITGMLSGAVGAAVVDGVVPRNVFLRLGRQQPATVEEAVFLTSEEFDLIHAHAKYPDARDLLELMFYTGLRVGEATVLRPQDVDLDEGTLRVTRAWKRGGVMGAPKSARSRRKIALGKERLDMLEPRVKRGGELLFTNTRGTQMMQASLRVYTWVPAVRAAQREGLTKQPKIHDLRHSHAAYLLSAGAPLLLVSRRLGHSSIQITADRYGHLLPDVEDNLRRLL